MELRHLRYFLAVAEKLSFSRAAEKLGIAQPTLSRQIRDLEHEAGFRLFERTTTQVRLTAAGQYLAQHAERTLMQLDIAVTGAQQVAKGSQVEFKIGSDWNDGTLPITAAARLLSERHPKLVVDFVELSGYAHPAAVRSKKIDVGFISGLVVPSLRDLASRRLHTCARIVVLPAGHPLADHASVRLRELQKETWISLTDEHIPNYKMIVKQLMRRSRCVPKFGRTANSIAGMLAFVATRAGIALLPEIFLPPEPEGVRYLPADCGRFEMHAIWAKGNDSPLVAEYLAILKKIMAARKPPALGAAPSGKAHSEELGIS